jgi:hypothetical protein
MKTHAFRTFVSGVGMLAIVSHSLAAPASEVSDVTARRQIVTAAIQLTEPTAATLLPAQVVNLFNPAAFNQPDADDLAALAAAEAAAALNSANVKPATDNDLLERLAERITPSGTLTLGSDTLLVIGQKRLRAGDRITVTDDGKDHEIELTGVQRLTFTLRLNRAETTRRINP